MFWGSQQGRSKNSPISKKRRKKRSQKRAEQRKLRVEVLEDRRLLALSHVGWVNWESQSETINATSLAGDFDGSGTVNGLDFLTWQQGAGKTSGASTASGDATGDEAVDLSDLNAWKTGFGETTIVAIAPPDADSPHLADFDENGVVSGIDFLSWQLGFGTSTGAALGEGDANSDQAVTQSDLSLWESQFGKSVAEITSISSFPVPLTQVSPGGSLVYQTNTSGSLASPGDTDNFTIDLDDGQTITVVVEGSASLQATVELFDSGNASLGSASSAVAGQDAVLQVIPTTGAGTYTVTVGGLGGSTGTYTVQLILNAAVEEESHDGSTNDSFATAQNIDTSFLGLGFGTAQRGAVLGRSDGGGSGSLSQTQNNNVSRFNVLTFSFIGAPTPFGDGTLTVSAIADLDTSSEFLTLDAEGILTQNLFVSGGLQQQPVSTTLNFTQAQLVALLADDGTITVTVTPSSTVHNLGPNELTLEFNYPAAPPTTDFYSFTLAAGQSASLALTGQSSGTAALELLDAGGNVLTTGVGAGNVDQIINNFVSVAGGTYYANVIGNTGEYSLVVTRDADFDTEANNDLASSQTLGPALSALGYLSGEAPAGPAVEGPISEEIVEIVEEPSLTSSSSESDAVPVGSNRLIVRFGDLGEMTMFEKIVSMGGTLIRELPIIQGAVIELSTVAFGAASLALSGEEQPIYDSSDLSIIAGEWEADPSIVYAEPDYELNITDTFPNDPDFSQLWGLHNTGQTGGTPDADIDAPEAWDIFTGSTSVVIASIDTGVDYNHADLAPNMWQNLAELNGTPGVDDDGNGYIDDIYGIDTANNDSDPFDDNRHGSHTSGTFGAAGNNGIGVVGVNWDVQIMALKFLDGGGGGTTSAAIEAIEYMTMMKTTYGVNIVASNNSWGGGAFSTALRDAIQASNDAGIMFVAAAGNSGANADSSPEYPAAFNLDGIISVAATDQNDQLASFSNFGAMSVDLGAPGVNTLSTTPGNSYTFLSGTSMAAPHVAGAVGMLMASNPNASLAEIKAAILSSTDPISALTGITVSGGRLNLANALAILGDPGDYYQFEVQALDNLVLATTTPADGLFEFVNELDPSIELYDPTGALVGSDDNSGADGRNALLSHTATATGTYTVRVVSSSGLGEYVLNILGATGGPSLFEVSSTDPFDGALFSVVPTTMTVDLSSNVLLSTIDQADLLVNNVQATGVEIVDGDTVRFTLPSLVEGVNTVTIAAGAMTNLQNQPLAAFSSQIVIDTIAPRIIASSIQENDEVPAGTLVYIVQFDEELDATNLDATDVQLVGAINGSQLPTLLNYEAATSTLTLQYENLPEDQYALTLLSGDGAFEDLVGHDLDGEPVFPLPPNKSGNGIAGGSFVVNFTTDFGIAPYLVPLTPKLPLGSLIYDPSISGVIGTPADTDSFTIDIDDGQTITVVVEGSASLQATVELFDPSNASLGSVSSAAAGQDAVLQVIPTTGAGTYTVTVGGLGGSTGTYSVQLILNAAVEEESHDGSTNDTIATAQNLDSSFLGLGFGTAERGAVLGFGDGGGSGSLSQTQTGNVFFPNVLTFEFSNAPAPLGDGILTVTAFSDLNHSSEFLTLNAEGLFTEDLFVTGGLEQGFVSTTLSLTQTQIAALLADDGNITLTVTPSANVDNFGSTELTLDLAYSTAPPTTDFYSFTLAAGQSASLALTKQSGGTVSLELQDAIGNVLTTGNVAGNVDQIINNFVSATGGTYYANVIGNTSEYSLVVTRDADFDTEANNDLASAQDITLAKTVLGALSGFFGDPSQGLELISNGSFETSDFSDWTIETTGSPFRPWSVSGAGSGAGFGMVPTSPQDGTFVAWNGFDGGGPMEFVMYQDVLLPATSSVLELTWQDRAQWNFGPGAPATLPRLYDVEVRDPSTDALLTTLYSFSTGTQSTNPTGDTGWLTHSVDVSAYSGQMVRLAFQEQIPQSFTGPAQIEFDAISLLQFPEPFDYYKYEASAGDFLSIQTSIPASGPGEFVNPLDLALELYDPTGALVASSSDGELTHQATMTGSYVIQVSAENDTQGEYVLSLNSPPVILDEDLSLSSASIQENDFVTLDGLFRDGNTSAIHSVSVDWGDGTTSLANVDQIAHTFDATHQYLDDGLTPGGTPQYTYPITVIVINESASLISDPASTSVDVTNVVPLITSFDTDATYSSPAYQGDVVNFSATFVDIGTLDTHTAVVDWGDGSPAEAVALVQGAGGGSISVSHTYSGGGIYLAELTLTDDDTGQQVSTTTSVVTGEGLRNGKLHLVGTPGNDFVSVGRLGERLLVSANFFAGSSPHYYNLSDVDMINVYLLSGNDQVVISSFVQQPTLLDGGSGDDILFAGSGDSVMLGRQGNDRLTGGSGNDLLRGGDGNDVLNTGAGNNIAIGGSGEDSIYGGLGRSILIGGLGYDRITSKNNEDILIGGTTAYDSQDAALMLLLDEWASSRSYLERTTNISDGLGPELAGTGIHLKENTTVFDDGEFDWVHGTSGEDWFFSNGV